MEKFENLKNDKFESFLTNEIKSYNKVLGGKAIETFTPGVKTATDSVDYSTKDACFAGSKADVFDSKGNPTTGQKCPN